MKLHGNKRNFLMRTTKHAQMKTSQRAHTATNLTLTFRRVDDLQRTPALLVLLGLPLLDGDAGAVGDGEVDGGLGTGHVEGHPVVLGEHGDLVGADLVGRVPVGHDAVSAHHHRGDALLI